MGESNLVKNFLSVMVMTLLRKVMLTASPVKTGWLLKRIGSFCSLPPHPLLAQTLVVFAQSLLWLAKYANPLPNTATTIQ